MHTKNKRTLGKVNKSPHGCRREQTNIRRQERIKGFPGKNIKKYFKKRWKLTEKTDFREGEDCKEGQ